MIATIKIVKNTADPFLKKLGPKVDIQGNLTAWNIAQKGSAILKHQASLAGIESWRGKLLSRDGIQARKLNKGRYGIFIPYYGYELDHMRGFRTKIRRGTLLSQWARDKNPNLLNKTITLHNYPFIEDGWRQINNLAIIEVAKLEDEIMRET